LIARFGVNEAIFASISQLWWLGIPLMVCGGIALALVRQRRWTASVGVFACVCPLFVTSLLIVAAERINPHQTSRRVTDFIEAGNGESAICQMSLPAPSLIYYAEHPVARLDSAAEVEEFFDQHPHASLVTTNSAWERLTRGSNIKGMIVLEVPRFPKSGTVLVVQSITERDDRELVSGRDGLTER
jgi:hypothetical protein